LFKKIISYIQRRRDLFKRFTNLRAQLLAIDEKRVDSREVFATFMGSRLNLRTSKFGDELDNVGLYLQEATIVSLILGIFAVYNGRRERREIERRIERGGDCEAH